MRVAAEGLGPPYPRPRAYRRPARLAKGAQLGVVLSFMMAVTTLSLPSMIMLRKAIRPRLLALFIVICTVGIIIVGYVFNALQFLFV